MAKKEMKDEETEADKEDLRRAEAEVKRQEKEREEIKQAIKEMKTPPVADRQDMDEIHARVLRQEIGRALYDVHFSKGAMLYLAPIPNIAEALETKPENVRELINQYLDTIPAKDKKRLHMLQHVEIPPAK